MKPKEILKETSKPALKQLIDCILKQKDKDEDYYNHLFNIKRLILEIQYENVEKRKLVDFFKDIDNFLETKMDKIKDCRNVLQLLDQDIKGSELKAVRSSKAEGKYNFFDSFFNATTADSKKKHTTHNYDKYTCIGKIIEIANNLEMGKIIRDTTLVHRYLPEGSPITREDLNSMSEDDLKGLYKSHSENLHVGTKHRKAVFLATGESLKKLKEDDISVEKKLYKLGLPAFQYSGKIFILYFNLKDHILFTPTTLDIWLDYTSYFLPTPPDDGKGKGHFGLTVFIPDPENKDESGLPEAVTSEFSCPANSVDIDYLGINETDELLEDQYKKNFKHFVDNLKINYKI